jgi:hypothetical protein
MKGTIHKWIFLALASIVCATMNAQDNNKLAVESFAKDEKDKSARITNPRKDQNDKVCAIVKIETPEQLQYMTFDAGMTSVEHSEQKKGEIWLWMSPGSQKLTITYEYPGTVRNYPFGEALKPEFGIRNDPNTRKSDVRCP